MQVVYSGGTSTPSPSPRIQRKIGYSRPVMPGYNTHVQPQVFTHRPGEKLTEGDTTLRDSIPLMSKGVAVLCLILNVLLPGSGTLTAGLSVLCCSKVRPRGGTKRHCIRMNAGLALIQFLLTFLFLLGWIWSITWGVAFLTISRQHSNRQAKDNRHRNHEGEKSPHAKIYDTSRHSPSNSNNHSPHIAGKPHRQHHHHAGPEHHHADLEHHQQHEYRHNTDHLDYHQNNNRSHVHKHERKSRSPSPRHSPGIRRNENSWVSVTEVLPQTPPINSNNSHPHATEDNNTTVPYQPIIVLQKAPELTQTEGSPADVRKTLPNDTIMTARTRHMKMLQRKMSDNDLSPFVLTNKQLEAIVIHDLPLVSTNGARSGQIVEEDIEGLPKMEM